MWCFIPSAARTTRRARAALPLALGALLAACATGRGAEYPPPPRAVATTVYVAAAGWHADIVVPRADIPLDVWPEAADFPDAEYLRIGWGDRDYYPSTEFNAWYGFKALFWPTASVLHVVGFSRPPARQYPGNEIVALELAADEAARLYRFIGTSHERNGAQRAPRLSPSPYGRGWFYPSSGSFHLFRTCNVWTASALRAAGLPVRSFLALTTGSVMAQVRSLGRVIQAGAAAEGCRVAARMGDAGEVALISRPD